MSKEVGYFLDEAAKKKVKKARALDESLLGRHYDKKKLDKSYDRIFGKEKKKTICIDCKKEVIKAIVVVEDNKLVTRCYKCTDNRKKK